MSPADWERSRLGGANQRRRARMAKWFSIGCGLVLLLLGLWGMLAADPYQFLVFGTSPAQNVLHILSGGLALIAGMSRPRWAVLACLALGALYGLLAVLGFMGARPAIEALHLARTNDYLHLVIGVGGLWAGGSAKGA